MKHALISLVLMLSLAGPAQAACFVHYKAKMDNPLRLHYGIYALKGAACPANAEATVEARLAALGWTLLTVLDQTVDTPTATQRANAGEYFLRD